MFSHGVDSPLPLAWRRRRRRQPWTQPAPAAAIWAVARLPWLSGAGRRDGLYKGEDYLKHLLPGATTLGETIACWRPSLSPTQTTSSKIISSSLTSELQPRSRNHRSRRLASYIRTSPLQLTNIHHSELRDDHNCPCNFTNFKLVDSQQDIDIDWEIL